MFVSFVFQREPTLLRNSNDVARKSRAIRIALMTLTTSIGLPKMSVYIYVVIASGAKHSRALGTDFLDCLVAPLGLLAMTRRMPLTRPQYLVRLRKRCMPTSGSQALRCASSI